MTLPPSIQVADRTIEEAEPRPTEVMSVSEMLARSSNIGTVMLAQLLGSKRLASWITRFGFGQKTGIDFPGESRGIVLPRERWSGSTIGNVPIGQGIAVTPIQMAAMYGALANNGVWIEPHLVDHVRGRRIKRPARHRVLSSSVSREVISMLQGVVSGGTGEEAAVPGYLVAGKTGTAQRVASDGTGYDGSTSVSFGGFAPADDARFTVYVVVHAPKVDGGGGSIAGPVFSRIMGYVLGRYGVEPTNGTPSRLPVEW